MNAEFNMHHIRFHQYRMQVIARWPDGVEKQVALSAADAALRREVVFETEKCARALGSPSHQADSRVR